MPGFQSSLAPRPNLQGESKQTIRWDLMRPQIKRLAHLPETPPANSDELDYWKERVRTHDSGPKCVAILERDFSRRHEVWRGWPPTVARQAALAVSRRHAVPLWLMLGESRLRQAVLARQELCYLLHFLPFDRRGSPTRPRFMEPARTRFSWKEIARFTNRRDHTTCIHAVQAVKARLGMP